jgi:Zn finger protein HypA/HybF involved in hydrogenase expression
MKCKKCDVELVKGEVYKDSEGWEAMEYICPKCKEKYVDIKIPNKALFQQRSKNKVMPRPSERGP